MSIIADASKEGLRAAEKTDERLVELKLGSCLLDGQETVCDTALPEQPVRMKSRVAGALLFLAFFVGGKLRAEVNWRSLFDGKSLAGWETYLSAPLPTSEVPGAERDATGNYIKVLGVGYDPLKCFSVVEIDGRPAIRLSGEGYGTLTTLESFSNYHLRLQFKWGAKKWLPGSENKPRGSGLLYHGHGNHGDADSGKRWLHTQQFQIQEGNCGDYVVVGDTAADITAKKVDEKSFVYDAQGQTRTFYAKTPNQSRCAKAGLFEKPLGDWNTLELICVGATAVHVVNGHVVLRLMASRKTAGDGFVPLKGGRLQLQMEGAEVFFRDIEIEPATEVPAVFRQP